MAESALSTEVAPKVIGHSNATAQKRGVGGSIEQERSEDEESCLDSCSCQMHPPPLFLLVGLLNTTKDIFEPSFQSRPCYPHRGLMWHRFKNLQTAMPYSKTETCRRQNQKLNSRRCDACGHHCYEPTRYLRELDISNVGSPEICIHIG